MHHFKTLFNQASYQTPSVCRLLFGKLGWFVEQEYPEQKNVEDWKDDERGNLHGAQSIVLEEFFTNSLSSCNIAIFYEFYIDPLFTAVTL